MNVRKKRGGDHSKLSLLSMKIEYTNLVFNGITAFIGKTSFSREKSYNI